MVPTLNAANHPLRTDLDHVLERTRDVWPELRGSRLFVTGGTGFMGSWLLETFAWANARLDLGAEMVVLTRDPERFHVRAPHLVRHKALHFHLGDVRNFAYPAGDFHYILHGATESSHIRDQSDHLGMMDTIVQGTRHTLEFARTCHPAGFLLVSSGAIYGPQPDTLSHIDEGFTGAPDTLDPQGAYAEGKRAAETYTNLYAERFGLRASIARCFAFLGPFLPLDAHFAAGNFIRDALAGGPIRITGDGTPIRSYLYAADLAVWLWRILVLGQSRRAYNCGSDEAMSVYDLAHRIGEVAGGNLAIVTSLPPCTRPGQRYVPSIARARAELGLDRWITLEEGIHRTLHWHRPRSA